MWTLNRPKLQMKFKINSLIMRPLSNPNQILHKSVLMTSKFDKYPLN